MSGPCSVHISFSFLVFVFVADGRLRVCIGFDPKLDNKQRERIKKMQLMQHLQLSVAPDVFTKQGMYDGDNILLVPMKLRLANAGQGTVRIFFFVLILCVTSWIGY